MMGTLNDPQEFKPGDRVRLALHDHIASAYRGLAGVVGEIEKRPILKREWGGQLVDTGKCETYYSIVFDKQALTNREYMKPGGGWCRLLFVLPRYIHHIR